MFSGIVIHGDGIGRNFGFPTANIECKIKKGTKVATGVFAATIIIDKVKYNGALIVLSKGNSYKFEFHILDFDKNIYGKFVEVDLVQKVSEVERHDSIKELVEKIKEDIEMVKEVFAGRY
ncbi:MAG: riboflavin kinase [Candidatus Magasanikbacteria bacterium]